MIIPAARYRDCEAALAFLTSVLGLVEHAVFRDEAGRMVHGQLTLGGGMVMIGPESGPESGGEFGAFIIHPRDTGGRDTVTIYGVVSDVAARHSRAVAAGAEILIPLRREPYGGESFTLRDPEGHVWSFGSYDPFAPVPDV